MNGRQFEDRDRTEKHRQHFEKRANTTGRGIDISEIFSLPAPRTITSQVLERILKSSIGDVQDSTGDAFTIQKLRSNTCPSAL